MCRILFQPSYKGKYLLEHVCQQLNLTETDYFGLRYVDGNGQRVSCTTLNVTMSCRNVILHQQLVFNLYM